jgi:hypothetical protein
MFRRTLFACSFHSPTPDTLAAFGKGARAYLAIPEGMPILASNRDPLVYEYGGAKGSGESGAYAVIHSGGITVSLSAGGMAGCPLAQQSKVTRKRLLIHGRCTLLSNPPNGVCVACSMQWVHLCLAPRQGCVAQPSGLPSTYL